MRTTYVIIAVLASLLTALAGAAHEQAALTAQHRADMLAAARHQAALTELKADITRQLHLRSTH